MTDMRIPFLLACAALALSADADPKAQAKSVWTAAAKVGDVWTCLQLESWGRSGRPAQRLGSVLGDSTVLGDPLFSFPARIEMLADFGDHVVVSSGSRVHVLAPDGRPLQPSVVLPASGHKAIGYDGKAVGAVEREDAGVRFVAVRLADGVRTISALAPAGPAQSLGDGRVVADDASAMAIEINTLEAASGRTSVSVVMATAMDRAPRAVEIRPGLRGIGRGGAWLISGLGQELEVLIGTSRRTASAAAIGPGLAACLSEGKARLVLADGRDASLAGAPALGHDAGLATVGNWLVLASGSGAKSVAQEDLLGDDAGVETDQPPTLAFWRWADLAADPGARPVSTTTGWLTIASAHAAALWAWQGKQLDLIDLSGSAPRREPYLQAANDITWVSSDLHCVRLHHNQELSSLYGPDKRELWSGPCSNISVKRRDLGLIERRDGERYSWSLVTLSPDPAKRKETRLEIPDQEQWIWVSNQAPDLIVALVERHWWRSVGFDGKVIERARDGGPDAVPRPHCAEWGWFSPAGRFYRDGVRVRLKAEAPPDDVSLADLDLADAWRIGSSTILLNRSGRVLVSGRKRGEWLDLPAIAPADRLGLAGGSLVAAAGDERRLVAALLPGPKLEAREGLGAVLDLPAGPWRIESGHIFTPPRGRQLEWDEERFGCRPLRLRSPEGAGMFVITPAVMIELDPAAAKMFGR